MSLNFKDVLNKKIKKISLDFSTEKQLKNRINRFKQKANATQDNLFDIQAMQAKANIDYFDIVRRHDYEKALEETEKNLIK